MSLEKQKRVRYDGAAIMAAWTEQGVSRTLLDAVNGWRAAYPLPAGGRQAEPVPFVYEGRAVIEGALAALLAGDAMEALASELLPLAEIITPNIPELTRLTGVGIVDLPAMERAARQAAATYHTAVLAKGGHFTDAAVVDLLAYPEEQGGRLESFAAPRSANPNTHGTGCTLSSAIAANLAKGNDLVTAVGQAKAYLTGAINANLDLGKGRGPLHHGWNLSGDFFA